MSRKQSRRFLSLTGIFFIFPIIWIVQLANGVIPYVDRWTDGFVTVTGDTFIFTVFRYITELGSAWFLIPLVIVMGILIGFLLRDIYAAAVFMAGPLLTHFLNVAIKGMIERERPSVLGVVEADGYSFPSGHAMLSMVTYGLMAYFLSRYVSSRRLKVLMQIGLLLVILLVGISRYIINVHYLTDVITGFGAGFICLIGFIYLYKFIRKSVV